MNDSSATPAPLITVDSNTKDLLRAILIATKVTGAQHKFVCPRGQSKAILDRVRMMLSRQRKKMEASGRSIKQFRLMSQVHPLINTDKELVILWQHQAAHNQLDELIIRALSQPV